MSLTPIGVSSQVNLLYRSRFSVEVQDQECRFRIQDPSSYRYVYPTRDTGSHESVVSTVSA